MQPVNGVAYAKGSIPAFGGGALAREGTLIMPGGMDYDDDPRKCQEYKTDGTRCNAFAVGEGTRCIGHRNRADKEARVEDDA